MSNANRWAHVGMEPGDRVLLESEFWIEPVEIEAVYDDGRILVKLPNGQEKTILKDQVKEYLPR